MKKVIIFAAILLSCSTGMQAQTENGDNDDVITITDKDGKAHIAVAVILFISATYNTISCTIGDEFISFDFPFTVLIAIWFAIVVVAIAGFFIFTNMNNI